MNYSLATLWHERPRFLPGIGAVAFSAVLMALQGGLLLGLFRITSIPVDNTRADVWVGSSEVLSVDLGRPIELTYVSRVAGDPRVERVEAYYQAYASLIKPDGGSELCVLIGSCLDDDNLGSLDELTPEMRLALTEPNTIVIDRSELKRVGVEGVGDHVEINKVRVRIVGLTQGLKSLAGPYVFCSRPTARLLLRNMTPRDTTTYYLIKCKDPADGPAAGRRPERRVRGAARHDGDDGRRLLHPLPLALADEDQGRHRPGVHGPARPAGRDGGDRARRSTRPRPRRPRSTPSCWRWASRGGR